VSNTDCAFLFLTDFCNLSCGHCYVNASPQLTAEMPLYVVERSVQVFMSLGIRDVRLTGGEATMHSAFRRIVSHLHISGCRVGLVTNGVRILREEGNEDLWEKLSRCWVSLYGTTPVAHRLVSQRPELSFDGTIRRVGHLAGRGYPVGLSVLLSPGEGRNVESLVRNVGAAGVRRLRFIPLQPDGRARGNQSIEWSDWPEEISSVADTLARRSYSEFDVLTINDPFDVNAEFSVQEKSCLLHDRQMWAVIPNGDVYPCCFTVGSSNMKIGNVMSPTIDGELSRRVLIGQHPGGCRGLSARFWPAAIRAEARCPIRSFDPRVARKH